MEVALVTFVGAGLTTLSAGFGIAVPEGAIARGYEIVRYLSQEDSPRTKKLVMQTVGEMWQDWRQSYLPVEVARQHLEALPQLMDHYRLPSDLLVGAIGAASASIKQGGAGNNIHGRRLAAQFVDDARAGGAFTEHGISGPIAFFFVDRLYSRLLAERGFVDSLLPLLDAYFYKGLWRHRLDQPAGAGLALEQIAASADTVRTNAIEASPGDGMGDFDQARTVAVDEVPLALSSPFAETELHAEPAPYAEPEFEPGSGPGIGPLTTATGDHVRNDTLSDQAVAECRALAEAVVAIVGGAPAADKLRADAAQALLALQLSDADSQLASAEDIELQTAQSDIGNVRPHLAAAAETRAARACIEECRGQWRRAARHYTSAFRCLPTSDIKGRGMLLHRQALALMKQGNEHGDTAALAQAAAVFADAGALQEGVIATEEWAAGQLTLANLLLVIGDREGRIDRYEAAARHARAASDAWSRCNNMFEWARGQLAYADAVRRRGEHVRSMADLDDAQFAYRAALGIFGRDRAPEEWANASANLGLTLVRQGELGAEGDQFQQGLASIDGALTVASRTGVALDVAKLQLARGNALLGIFASSDSEEYAAQATEAFSQAIAACDRDKHPSEVLSMRHRLGMAMWAFGARVQSPEILGEAAQELMGVLDDAEHLDDAVRVRELNDDLAALHDDMARTADRIAAPERKIA